jgi:hypothetical protein
VDSPDLRDHPGLSPFTLPRRPAPVNFLDPNMLSLENTVLTVVDVQGKLAQLVRDKEALFHNLQPMMTKLSWI